MNRARRRGAAVLPAAVLAGSSVGRVGAASPVGAAMNRARRRGAAVLLAVVLAGGAVPAFPSAQEQYALVVAGASGDAALREKHARWRDALVTALRGLPGFDDARLTVLAETPGPGVGRASRAGVEQALNRLADDMGDAAVLHVVLIGHGSFDGADAKFNLVGPDLEAGEWDRWLSRLPGRLVFVNTTGASFPFLRRLSAPGRTVVTATDSAAQRYDTVFPRFFIDALTAPAADEDRDGRVSVLEAFEFAGVGVREWYRRQGRLATERALLDDDGDGRGREAGRAGPDGVLAARLHVGAGTARLPAAVTDPATASLAARRSALVEAVRALKAARPRMAPEAYRDDLERTLIELARVSRRLRQAAPSRRDC